MHLVVPVFPFDPKLENLPHYFSQEFESNLLSRWQNMEMNKDVVIEIIDREVLGYRLEKRCVICFSVKYRHMTTDATRTAKFIVKIYRPRHVERAANILKMLAENGFSPDKNNDLTVPKLLYSDKVKGELHLEYVTGNMLHNLTSSIIFEQACIASGRLLKKLHSIHGVGMPEFTAVNELTELSVKVELGRMLFPALQKEFMEIFDNLNKEKPESPYNVCSHRDFYDKQVLYSEDRTTLLDCDNLAMADPALDYGNFIAHLTLRSLQHPDDSHRIETGIHAFKNAYGKDDKSLGTRAAWWYKTSLVRLAVLYGLRPRWKHLAAVLLKQARTIKAF
jgi:hypothetical protein